MYEEYKFLNSFLYFMIYANVYLNNSILLNVYKLDDGFINQTFSNCDFIVNTLSSILC